MPPISAHSQDSLERQTLTTSFPFSEKVAVLADGYSGHDREALRSFAALHDVRRFDFTRVLVIHTIYDIVSSNAQPLQPDEQPTGFISTLTVPAEVVYILTRDAPGGEVVCRDISAESRSATTVDSAV